MARISLILEKLNEVMPFELAESYDNIGLLAGSRDKEITKVLCALDMNEDVIAEASDIGAQLIITHHPLMFRGRKNISTDDPEGRLLTELIRKDIAHIAMHTNFDSADKGVNDALAATLGLTDVVKLEKGMRMGHIDKISLGQLESFVGEKLGGAVRRYGDREFAVSKVAVMGGSAGDYYPIALAAGADVFVTGECGYHDALDALNLGLCVLEAGHAATELPAVSLMSDILSTIVPDIEVKVSTYIPYR